MALTPGTRIGPYEVTSPLGEGGMGVVFRAHDTQLQRDVALKLLPDHFADDADRLLRFQREAQLLATLNHPNIAQIYGLEESKIAEALEPAALFPVRIAGGPLPGPNKQQYAVSSDGQRFLVNLAADEGATSPITLIYNWHPKATK